MMKMNEMGERPPMPDMKGANMREEGPLDSMPEKAKENLMMPSEEIGAVLMARLVNMSPQELQMFSSIAIIVLYCCQDLHFLHSQQKIAIASCTHPHKCHSKVHHYSHNRMIFHH